jgi:1-acyl-sn-glycerol-3-phosphate acyltransferase
MSKSNKQPQQPDGLALKFFKSAGMMALGFAAVTVPLQILLRRELRDAPDEVRAQGWPIRLAEVLFLRYVLPWIEVEGLENLPDESYLLASNHAYKSGVDGFLLGHLLATRAGRVPRIVITSDSRSWAVSAERWVLHHYGIALLVPDAAGKQASRHGLTDVIANYLCESGKHSVIIFPAGRAAADPVEQLQGWSSGVVVSAQKSGSPIVPVAIGGLKPDSTPETVLISAVHATDCAPPFRIRVRIGKPITPEGDPHVALAQVRAAVAELMAGIPEWHAVEPSRASAVASADA